MLGVPGLTNGNCISQAMKKVRSCLEVMFALAERVFSKLCHDSPKMQRSMTERMLPA
jgi:hypothetical protein